MIIQLSHSGVVIDFTGTTSATAYYYTGFECTVTHDVANKLISFPIPANAPTVIWGGAANDWSGGGTGGAEGFNISSCSDLFTISGQLRDIEAFWAIYYLTKFSTASKSFSLGLDGDYKSFKVQCQNFNAFWKPGTDEDLMNFTLQLLVVNE